MPCENDGSVPGRDSRGLTLIEVVVAIVVIGIGAGAIMLMLAEGYRGSPDPQLRIKAAELGQSYMDEILTKPWDEKTPQGGGCVRPQSGNTNCGSGPQAECPPAADCGEDGGESRATYDDVDDYAGLCEGSATACQQMSACASRDGPMEDASGQTRSGRYNGFCVDISVTPGVGDELQNVAVDDAKRIDVRVANPAGVTTTFTTYRLNY